MSVKQLPNSLYGFTSPISPSAFAPIVSLRTPTTSDFAPLGAIWIYKTGDQAYILTSIVSNSATWQLLESSGAAGSFTTLTSTGATTLATTGASVNTFGNVTGATSVGILVGTGNFTLTGAASSTVTIGTGITTGAITIGAAQTTGTLTLGSTTGLTKVTPATGTITFPASTGGVNANVSNIVCDGFTTANGGATQVFTITNNKVSTSSHVTATVSSLDASTNGALLSIKGLVLSANTLKVTVANNGAGALGAGDNIILSFVVNS